MFPAASPIASPLIGGDPAVTPVAAPLPEPAAAWSEAAAQAVKDHAALIASVTSALENAEESDFCEKPDEDLMKAALVTLTGMTADLAKVVEAAKVAVEDEAEAAEQAAAEAAPPG
jgi:hypothetical protein